MDWLDFLAVQGTLKCLLQHQSWRKASILQCLAFFIVQLSHPYTNTEKTSLTRQTFVVKVMSLHFNMLSLFVCILISQEAGQVGWYSHLLKNFPQFIVIHTVKGFGIVNRAEVDVLLELSCFSNDPTDVGNLISGSSAFSKTSLNIWKFMVHVLLKPGLENFEHYFTSM